MSENMTIVERTGYFVEAGFVSPSIDEVDSFHWKKR